MNIVVKLTHVSDGVLSSETEANVEGPLPKYK